MEVFEAHTPHTHSGTRTPRGRSPLCRPLSPRVLRGEGGGVLLTAEGHRRRRAASYEPRALADAVTATLRCVRLCFVFVI